MAEVNLKPQLRFPKFEGEWRKVKLKDVSTYFNGGSFENDVQEKGKYELVTLKSIDTRGNLVHSKRFIDIEVPTLSKDTLVMILSEQAPGLLGMTALIPTDNNYVLNQRVAEIRPNNKVESYFLSKVINRNQRYFSKLGAGTKVQNITKPNVENYEFLCPSLPEQTKIANFLTAVDKRINLLQKKKAELEQYKKGIMQKLFSQTIRFKDENGNDFPDWEEKKLGEVLDYLQPTNYLVSDTEYKDQYNIPVLTAGKSFLLGYTNETEGVFSDNLPTIIFDDFTTAIQYVDFPFKAKSSAMKMLIPISEEVNIKYIYEVMRMIKFPLAEHKRYWISEYQNEKIPYPCKEEQTKIANFLSSIDKSIEKVGCQIETSTKFKQGLLQKMFV